MIKIGDAMRPLTSKFDKDAVDSAMTLYHRYEDAFDKSGILKTKAKLETKFKL